MINNIKTMFWATIMVVIATGILIGAMHFYETMKFNQEWKFQPTTIQELMENDTE